MYIYTYRHLSNRLAGWAAAGWAAAGWAYIMIWASSIKRANLVSDSIDQNPYVRTLNG